jgi:septal ring factor EnvC (AmiA/AmiB activator)
LYNQSIDTDKQIFDLKNEILERAKKIATMKYSQSKQNKGIQATNTTINDINIQLTGLVDTIKKYQQSIHTKNDEMMKQIDDFNQIVIILLELSNKLNNVVIKKPIVTRQGGKSRKYQRRRRNKPTRKRIPK